MITENTPVKRTFTLKFEDLSEQDVQNLVDLASNVAGNYDGTRRLFGNILKSGRELGFKFKRRQCSHCKVDSDYIYFES